MDRKVYVCGWADHPLSVEDSASENGMADGDEPVEALVTFSEDDLTRCDRQNEEIDDTFPISNPSIQPMPSGRLKKRAREDLQYESAVDLLEEFSCSKANVGQRRRLRFSELDDMVLLRFVATLNPYKNSLWREVTQEVAFRTGKNFTARSVRDHTDLLMNTFVLRGVHACLKRTPPNLWEKKRRLLKLVHSMWKRDTLPSKSSAADTASDDVLRKDRMIDDESEPQTVRAVQTLKSYPAPSVIASSQPVVASALKSSPNSSTLPILLQPPLTLHFQSPVSSIPCPPLMPTGALSSKLSQLAKSSPVDLQKLAVATDLSSVLGRPMQPLKLLPALAPGGASDQVGDFISSDQPLCLSMNSSSIPSKVALLPTVVDRSTSPIPSADCLSVESALHNGPNNDQSPSSGVSVGSSTNVSTEFHNLKRSSGNGIVNKRQRISSMMKARLNFLQNKHRDQYVLKRREMDLEKRKLDLEERKLTLEERKVRLDEEKWWFDKKEREDKLLMLSEDREHKMAMEKRQQNMIDILLDLRKE